MVPRDSSEKKILVVIVAKGAYSFVTSLISSRVSSVDATATAISAASFFKLSSFWISSSLSRISPLD